ncbi:hypothetical protein [Flavivirga jejuensis]|uniref:Uncharacterized protein n=1 Tax=Flavivirga jejuensis TaxID=870487 RepID=A0ABT8WSM3_9FLAO|nr:hypothetical protein [Flavivirga jejuensis]MDO5976000.1 hypothetical protein [Flavivirga jejuensis]
MQHKTKKRQVIDIFIISIVLFLLVELFKIIFSETIWNYFSDRNVESDAITLTILFLREAPFLFFTLFLFLVKGKMNLKWFSILLGLILAYLINLLIY